MKGHPPIPAPLGGTSWFRRTFPVDVRSLALVRVLLGVALVTDVVSRAFTGDVRLLTDAFSDRTNILERMDGSIAFSFYLGVGSAFWVRALALVHICAGAAFTVGWRTHMSGFILWVLTVSVGVRSPQANNGGDRVVLQLLLWTCLLPCGETYTVDALLRRWKGRGAGAQARSGAGAGAGAAGAGVGTGGAGTGAGGSSGGSGGGGGNVGGRKVVEASFATAGLLLMIPMVYLHSGWNKVLQGGPEWHVYGWRPSFAPPRPDLLREAALLDPSSATPTPLDAVALTLCVDRFLMWPGHLLRALAFSPFAWAWMTRTLTASTLVLECLGPWLFLLPQTTITGGDGNGNGGGGGAGKNGPDRYDWRGWGGRLRGVLMIVYILFWVGLGGTLWLGLFPWGMTIGVLPHIPGHFWDAAASTRLGGGLVGGMWRRLVGWVARCLVTVGAADDEAGGVGGGSDSGYGSYDDDWSPFTGSSSITAAAAIDKSGKVGKTGKSTPPPLLEHRRRVQRGLGWARRFARKAVAAGVLFTILTGHAAHFVEIKKLPWPFAVWMYDYVALPLQLQQEWPMFAYNIKNYGGWVEVRGTLMDDSEVDLLLSMKQLKMVRPDEADDVTGKPQKELQALHEKHLPQHLYMHDTQRWLNIWNGLLERYGSGEGGEGGAWEGAGGDYWGAVVGVRGAGMCVAIRDAVCHSFIFLTLPFFIHSCIDAVTCTASTSLVCCAKSGTTRTARAIPPGLIRGKLPTTRPCVCRSSSSSTCGSWPPPYRVWIRRRRRVSLNSALAMGCRTRVCES